MGFKKKKRYKQNETFLSGGKNQNLLLVVKLLSDEAGSILQLSCEKTFFKKKKRQLKGTEFIKSGNCESGDLRLGQSWLEEGG